MTWFNKYNSMEKCLPEFYPPNLDQIFEKILPSTFGKFPNFEII